LNRNGQRHGSTYLSIYFKVQVWVIRIAHNIQHLSKDGDLYHDVNPFLKGVKHTRNKATITLNYFGLLKIKR